MMMPMHGASPVVVAATIAVGSACLIATGLRGQRVNDHPICRRCGFDLFGLPGGSDRCSEWGAELARRRAIRHGQRVRPRRQLAVAVPLFLASLTLLGFRSFAIVRVMGFQRLAPTWWVTMEAMSRPSPRQTAALTEARRRMVAGQLSSATILRLVDHALSVQADQSVPWASDWGLLIEDARKRGWVDLEHWSRYVRQAVAFQLSVGNVYRGDGRLDRHWAG